MKLQGDSSISVSRRAEDSTAPRQTNSEGQYRNLIQNLPQAVFETDRDGRWSFLNESWRLLSGFGLDECIGTSYLSYVHPQDRTRCKQVFAKLQRSEVSHCTRGLSIPDQKRQLSMDGSACSAGPIPGWRL